MKYGLCFTFKLIQFNISFQTGYHEIYRDLDKILPHFKGNPPMATAKPTCTYLPQEQAPGFPHGWLRFSISPIYSHYDWVEHNETGKFKC